MCENTTKEKTVRLCNRDLWFQFLEDLKVEKSIKTSEHDLGQVWTEQPKFFRLKKFMREVKKWFFEKLIRLLASQEAFYI